MRPRADCPLVTTNLAMAEVPALSLARLHEASAAEPFTFSMTGFTGTSEGSVQTMASLVIQLREWEEATRGFCAITSGPSQCMRNAMFFADDKSAGVMVQLTHPRMLTRADAAVAADYLHGIQELILQAL